MVFKVLFFLTSPSADTDISALIIVHKCVHGCVLTFLHKCVHGCVFSSHLWLFSSVCDVSLCKCLRSSETTGLCLLPTCSQVAASKQSGHVWCGAITPPLCIAL